MRRRDFITLLGGATAMWPLAARAQQGDRVRRIGILIGFAENDEVWKAYLAALRLRLQELGWIDGRNARIDYRFTGENTERIRIAARELVATAPDVILASGNPALSALIQATRTIPIVFTWVSDSVGSGFVASLARPGGHITGFHNFEPRDRREVVGGAQADRAWCASGSGRPRSGNSRECHVSACGQSRCCLVGDDSDNGRRARHRRHRARPDGVRAGTQSRPHRDAEPAHSPDTAIAAASRRRGDSVMAHPPAYWSISADLFRRRVPCLPMPAPCCHDRTRRYQRQRDGARR
jgi:hypothetical protein